VIKVELVDLGKAILEWTRIRNRISLLAYDVNVEYSREMNKHLLKAAILIACDNAKDCSKIEEALTYLFENFDKLKEKPLTLLTNK
jgi:hypothetical protein